ncbi:hypothetical protein GOQ27_11980 [Clostridium sp. D2Q-11]|uniref:Lipoprotein n=1 Tax=Anaeromonas frigoriresistens TaxID=2683708 RepID=A0A942UX48_9FIRM|nr:hypothetical protein [Anaeromonas frigoriresistens]MBS4539185.1 hypothetical protein [Anaeromonas frigoriresistens]
MFKTKKIYAVLMLIILIFLSGCDDTDTSQGVIKRGFFEELNTIVIYKDVYYKEVKDSDIEGFISKLKSLEGESLDTSSLTQDDFQGTAYKIESKYNNDKDLKSISFIGDKMLYEDKWYKLDTSIESLYESIESKENMDKNRKKSKLIKENRKELPIKDALLGLWKYDDDNTGIEFTNNELIHFIKKEGKLEESRRFNYRIDNSTDNQVYITAYSKNGLFSKNKKLFNIILLFDDMKNNIIMKKEMVGSSMTYRNNLIYIHEEGFELGNFDSFFFIENRDYFNK